MKPTMVRTLIIAVLLLVQVATIAVVVRGMQRQANDAVDRHAEQTLISMGKTVANQADKFLAPAERAIRNASHLVSTGILNPNADQDLVQYFVAHLQANPYVKGLFLGRDDGSFMFVYKSDDGLKAKRIVFENGKKVVTIQSLDNGAIETVANDTYDPRKRGWFKKARSAKANNPVIWTDVYTFFTAKTPGLTTASSLTDAQGNRAGVMGIDIDVTDLSRFISDIPHSRRASAAIVAPDLSLVASSDLKRLNELLKKPKASMPTILAFAGEPLRALFNSVQQSGDLGSGSAQLRELTIANETHLGLARPLELSNGNINWSLMIQMPRDEYSGGLMSTLSNNLRLLAALVVLPILAIVAMLILTNPIYRMHRDATTDALTATLSRSEFSRKLTQMMRQNRRLDDAGLTVAVIALDLDGFKSINDKFGHHTGDMVLQGVAKRLESRLRNGELVSRVGGDEFLLALRTPPGKDIWRTAERLRRAIARTPIETDDGEHLVGVTLGVAVAKESDTWQSLVLEADQALIYGKGVRKNMTYLAETISSARRRPDRSSKSEEDQLARKAPGVQEPTT
jgi:diguanylate cyclase (GGDEF)-like protein